MNLRQSARSQEDPAFLDALTGIRGWAALWVFFYHAWGQAGANAIVVPIGDLAADLTPFFRMGGAGVSIFFVLSGFLLALPFVRWQAGLQDKPATGSYLLRRVARVFPAYYAQLAILLAVAYLSQGEAGLLSPPDMIRHLLMLFTPPPLGVEARNGVWWTLPIEFSFYLALPLLAPLLRANRWMWLLVLSLSVMMIWRHFVVVWLADSPVPARVLASYQLPGSADMFGLGMFAALVQVNRNRLPEWLRPPSNMNRSTVLGLLLVVVAIYWLHLRASEYWIDKPIFYLWTLSLSLGIVAIMLAAVAGGRLANAMFGNRFMVFSGTVSYSIYLWHLPILVWLKQANLIQVPEFYRLPVLVVVALGLTLVVSSISYVLVERPFMRLRLLLRG